MDPQIFQAAAAVVGAVIVIGGVGWKFFRAIGQFVHMIDDMAGTKARRGRPAAPGIMERLATSEATQNGHTEQLHSLAAEMAEQSEMLAAVSHEVHFNDGSSVKDSTTRTEAAVKAVATDVADIKRRLLPPPLS